MRTRYDDLDVPTPLRSAMASGDPVVVRAAADWFPRVREAAAVCGRLTDLIAVKARRARDLDPRAPVPVRFVDPDALGLAEHPDRAKWVPPDATSVLPTLTHGDLSGRSPVLFIASRSPGSLGSLSAELARIHLRLVPASTHVRYVRITGYPSGDSNANAAVMRENWIRPGHGTGRGRAASKDRTGAWAACLRSYRSLGRPADHDGTALLDRHGLRVLVHHVGEGPEGPTSHRLAVHAACADGWVESAFVDVDMPAGDPDADTVRHDLALNVARGDLTLALQACEARIMGQRGSGTTDMAALRKSLATGPASRLLGAHVDLATFLAASRDGHVGLWVMRSVTAAPTGNVARRDFVRSFPAASQLLLEPGFAAAVDSGVRTVPLIARALGTTPAVARRVAALPSLPGLCPRPTHPGALSMPLGAVLAAFGHDRLPAPGDAVEGMAFRRCLDGLNDILRLAGCALNRIDAADVARMLLGTPGRTWEARSERLARTMSDDAGDLLAGLAAWLHAMGHREGDVETAFALLAHHRGLPDILRASARWHATPALSSWTADVPHDATWPVPFDPLDLGDGWSAHALGSVAALQAEGARGKDVDGHDGLGHCVASYASEAMCAASLIVSIRHDEGLGPARRSTAEIATDEDGDWRLGGRAYALTQHRGRSNSEPSPEAEAALGRLREALGSGLVPINASALEERMVPEGEPTRPVAEAVLHLWRPLLPRTLARLDAVALLDRAVTVDAALEAARVGGTRAR